MEPEEPRPEEQPEPAGDATSASPDEAPRRAAPPWGALLVSGAILVAGLVVAGAVWFSRPDESPSNEELYSAIQDIQGQMAAASTSSAGADGGVSSAETLRTAFDGYAKQVGLDSSKFQACLGKQENVTTINAQLQRGTALGVSGTPTFFINNKKLVGSQPAAVFDEIIQAELKGSPTSLEGYSEAIQKLASANPPSFAIMSAPADLSGAQIKGSANARVKVAEFSDFQCPFCKRWTEQTLGRITSQYGNDVAIAFLHFPITQIHPNAGNAAVAAICAGEQGKFWEMHDLLFARQDEWGPLKAQ